MVKIQITARIIVAILVVLIAPYICLAYSGGSGTNDTPYQIANVADFQQLSTTPTDWNKSFILTADINLTGLTFTKAPIAPDTSTSYGFQGTQFTGIFNGNSHAISNLTITAYASDCIGLFGFVGSNGKISNLGAENFNIASRDTVGGLVGYNEGSLIACYTTGTITGYDWVGGLVGYNYSGTITDCYATSAISGTGNEVGGLVGQNDSGTLTSCYATGSVNGTGQDSSGIGGLVGANYPGTIIDCYSTGSVTGTIQNVGGLVGENGGEVFDCYANGSINGGYNIGGLVGENDGILSSCFWDTQTSGKSVGVGYGTSTGVTGKITAIMKTQNTFTSAGWDFILTWSINEGIDYPKLMWPTPGKIEVTLNPADAVSVGAQWNVDGGAWKNSGNKVTGLSVGLHTVNYKSIAGWNAPPSESVTINNGQTTSISRNYIQQTGSIQVTLVPAGAISAGAQWSIDGSNWQNSADIVTDISIGSHTVNYKSITGWIAPTSEQVTINSNQTTTFNRDYIQQTGQVSQFGNINGKNIKIILKDCSNNDVTFILTGGGYGEVDATDCSFSVITLFDTTDKSNLRISTKSKIWTNIGDIICDGPLKGISAKNIDISGDIEVGSSLNPKAGVSIVFDKANDLSIDSRMPIKSISATEWLGGSINAPSIGNITTKGDKKRSIIGDLDVNVTSGTIQSIKSACTLSGNWTCDSIKSISTINIVEANMKLNQLPDAKILALGKLTAKGWIDSSQIQSQGNIGTIKAGKMIDSNCFAGIAEGIIGLPTAETSNFPETATIKSIMIKSIKAEPSPYYINSNIAAANILNVSIRYPQSDNGGMPFGLSADYIKKLTIKKTDGTTTSLKELKESKDSQTIDGVEIRLY